MNLTQLSETLEKNAQASDPFNGNWVQQLYEESRKFDGKGFCTNQHNECDEEKCTCEYECDSDYHGHSLTPDI